ncbi:MAG: hypothetical protein VYC34_03825, partial [Planctomycetota bacterium]|nr:hypothetical protein [Planctomycetota bacterium]
MIRGFLEATRPRPTARPLRDLATIRAAQVRRSAMVGRILAISITALLIIALGRVVQLQAVPGDRLAEHIDDRMARVPEMAMRGDLLDRRGRMLASTRVGRRLFIDPTRFPEPYDMSIVRLSQALRLDADLLGTRVLSRIAENRDRRHDGRPLIRYVSMPGVLTDAQVEIAQRLDMPGVHLERIPVREPLEDPTIAALLGKVGFEHDGLLGAEYALQDRLAERDGRLIYVHDANGRPLWIEAGDYQPPDRGEDVRLSIDLAIQQIADEELMRGLEEANAAGGRVVIFDPWTGEILAMLDKYRAIDGLTPFSKDNLADGRALYAGTRYQVLPPDPRRAIHPALGRNRCVEDA